MSSFFEYLLDNWYGFATIALISHSYFHFMANYELNLRQRLDTAFSAPNKNEILQERCSFCSIPERKTTDQYQELYGSLPHTRDIPRLAPGWSVLQDVVPVAEDGAHLLLMPNMHRISFASVEDQRGVHQATETLIQALRAHYPNPIFTFEHGPGVIMGEQIACGGCHMDHAHGHLLVLPEETSLQPIRRRLEAELRKKGWQNPEERGVYRPSVFQNIGDMSGMNPYIQIGMIYGDEKHSLTYTQYSIDEHVESQLLRRIISDVVYRKPSAENWHWRDITEGLGTPAKVAELQEQAIAFRQKTGF